MISRHTMPVVLVWILAAAAMAEHPIVRAAIMDRRSYPASEQQFIYYLTTTPYINDEFETSLDNLERSMKLVLLQTSRQPILERTQPTKIAPHVYRIDIRGLGWNLEDWNLVAGKRNPYTAGDVAPMISRADWLVRELTDMQESDSYVRLLFGGKNIPKTRDEALKILGVGSDPLLTYGMIEGQSGVSVSGTRVLESRPIQRGYAWGTRDVLKLDSKRDPLEHPDLVSPHDGEEWIIGQPMVSITTGDRGTRQIYFLSNGQGTIVNRAPVDLVVDHTRYAGLHEIRFPGSCIQCHREGLNKPTLNLFAHTIKSGVDLFAPHKQREQLELFHMGSLTKDIQRANDDFQTMVELATGVPSIEAAASFKAAIDRYNAPLDLLDTAEELQVDVAQWARTIGTSGLLPARLSALPHGGTIPREAWEEYYVQAVRQAKGLAPAEPKKLSRELRQALDMFALVTPEKVIQ